MADAIDPKPVENATAPGGSDVDRLLTLIRQWQSEPLDHEEEIVMELDRTLREDPIQFREIDLSDWPEKHTAGKAAAAEELTDEDEEDEEQPGDAASGGSGSKVKLKAWNQRRGRNLGFDTDFDKHDAPRAFRRIEAFPGTRQSWRQCRSFRRTISRVLISIT